MEPQNACKSAVLQRPKNQEEVFVRDGLGKAVLVGGSAPRGQPDGQQAEEQSQAAFAEDGVGDGGRGVEEPAAGGRDAEGEAEEVDHGDVADAAQHRVSEVPGEGLLADLAEDLLGEDALIVEGEDHAEEQAEEAAGPPGRGGDADEGRSSADDGHGDQAEEEFVFGDVHESSKSEELGENLA